MSSPLQQKLCFSIYSASLEIIKFYKPLLAPLGLTYPQFLVMSVLWEKDGLAAGTLADHLGIDPGALTPMLKRMEASGLLKRQRVKGNERSIAITLTAKGRDLHGPAQEVSDAFGLGCGLSSNSAESLRETMLDLREQLAQRGSFDSSVDCAMKASDCANEPGNSFE